MSIAKILEVADAVLYEGYLLYPYRSTLGKSQSRWQFGVLGPPGACGAGLGEPPEMHAECLVRPGLAGTVIVHVCFLQLQSRIVEVVDPDSPSGYRPVHEIQTDATTFLTWDEAREHHIELGPFRFDELRRVADLLVTVDGGETIEEIVVDGRPYGRVVRRSWELQARVTLSTTPLRDGVLRFTIDVANSTTSDVKDRHEATRTSLLGAHVVLEGKRLSFISLLEPPDDFAADAVACYNARCWPVLAGDEGSNEAMLISPVILYDHPAVAAESSGSLFDSIEIDEILTLRVMTLTNEEKAAARSTDRATAAIIDRCDAMMPEELQRLIGVPRDPRSETRWAQGLDTLGGLETFDPFRQGV